MHLSENLTLKEAVKSLTAVRRGIDNTPTDDAVINNLKAVAKNIFQPIRDEFEHPIAVSSGYRGKELNTAIGGSKNSQHMSGEALDLDADVFGGLTNADIFYYIKNNLDFDQMIWEFGDEEEPDWIHVSYRSKERNRNRVLIAKRTSKGTEYSLSTGL